MLKIRPTVILKTQHNWKRISDEKFKYALNGIIQHTTAFSSSAYNPFKNKEIDYRKSVAPWLQFGVYQKGLLSHLSTSEILRALFVLQVCSVDFMVDKSSQLLALSNKFGGKFTEYFVRKTIYNQFVGGDEIKRMREVVEGLHRRGLTLMAAPVLEEDVEDEKSCKDVYDENLNTLLELVKMSSSMDKEKPIVQLKLSAIMPAKTLEQINQIILPYWKTPECLANLTFELASKPPDQWKLIQSKVKKEDLEHFINGIKRADIFVRLVKELNAKTLVDAEFFACQYAISTVALVLMTRHNVEEYVVGDTIQGYLKDAHYRTQIELEVIQNLLGGNWYAKVVRGAYMDRERLLAKKLGYASPICDSYEETNHSYDKCVDTILENLKENATRKRSHLLIASHNERSIRLAVQKMKNLDIPPTNPLVSFAQIYGMADYLSSPLVKNDYKVYKSTPYGPLAKVVPYLSRRASENRSVLKGAREERLMLRKELFSRLFG